MVWIQAFNISFIVLLILFFTVGSILNIVTHNSIQVESSVGNSLHNRGKYINVYKTRDGRKNFVFRYVPVQSFRRVYYEIDILSQPYYSGVRSGLHESHRLPSSRSDVEYKICIMPGHEPRDLATAMRISMDWAELTWKYIRTKKSIDEQVSER